MVATKLPDVKLKLEQAFGRFDSSYAPGPPIWQHLKCRHDE